MAVALEECLECLSILLDYLGAQPSSTFSFWRFARANSTSVIKYLIGSRRIFFRECMAKTGGVLGYIEDFWHVLSEE